MSNEVESLLNRIQFKTGQTLEEIANKIGKTRPYLNKVKKGKGSPTIAGLLKEKYPEVLAKDQKDFDLIKERIIELQASVNVFQITIVSLLSADKKSSVAVSAELKKAIQDEIDLLKRAQWLV